MSDASAVLKSVKPDDWAAEIHAGKAVVRFPNGMESGSFYNRPQIDGDKTQPYTRTDLIQPLIDAAVAKALEEAAGVIDDPGDRTVVSALSTRLCCDGRECGCYGADVGSYLAHHIRALIPASGTDALRQARVEAAAEAMAALSWAKANLQALSCRIGNEGAEFPIVDGALASLRLALIGEPRT